MSIPMIAQMRYMQSGVYLRTGQAFDVASEAEAAELVAVRAATRAPIVKSTPAPLPVYASRSMSAESDSSNPEQDTGTVLESPTATAEKTEEEKAKERAQRDQEARDRISGKHGQHLRRDMRARR